MCGRFVSNTPPDELARFLRAKAPDPGVALDPSYNIAPTHLVHAARENEGVRRLDTLRWGLVPFWAKDLRIGARMINARAETVATKNVFRNSLAKRRCIIPADGFYEWQRIVGSKRKQPMFISHPDGEPFAFAGLWEIWRDRDNLDADGEPLEVHSCTILTCAANEAIAKIHDRMPVILGERHLGLLARPNQHQPPSNHRTAGSRPSRDDPHAPRVNRRQQCPQRQPPPDRAATNAMRSHVGCRSGMCHLPVA